MIAETSGLKDNVRLLAPELLDEINALEVLQSALA